MEFHFHNISGLAAYLKDGKNVRINQTIPTADSIVEEEVM